MHAPELPAPVDGGNPEAGSAEPWALLGEALEDHWRGERDGELVAVLEDGRRDPLPVAYFFRAPEGLPEAEELALELARGRVLDAGAGAGSQALALQERGLRVTALDLSPRAVAVMRARGVRDARQGDLLSFPGEGFDTVLLLMNGLGVVGDLAGLDRLLARLGILLAPGGQLLVDSSDLRASRDSGERALLAHRQAQGRYFGEVVFRLEYRGRLGPPFRWLFVDPRTLRRRAHRHGWAAQLLFDDGSGGYLARLTARARRAGASPAPTP